MFKYIFTIFSVFFILACNHDEHNHDEHEHNFTKKESSETHNDSHNDVLLTKEVQKKLSITTDKAKLCKRVDSLTLTATIKPDNRDLYSLETPLKGNIILGNDNINPVVGLKVNKGDTLAYIKTTPDVEGWSSLEWKRKEVELELDIAKKEELRVKKRVEEGSLLQNQLYLAEKERKKAQYQLNDIIQKQESLFNNKNRVIPIKTTKDGIITNIFINNGDLVDAGDNLFQISTGERATIIANVRPEKLPKIDSIKSLILISGEKKIELNSVSTPKITANSAIFDIENRFNLINNQNLLVQIDFESSEEYFCIPQKAVFSKNLKNYIYKKESDEVFEIEEIEPLLVLNQLVYLQSFDNDTQFILNGVSDINLLNSEKSSDPHAGHNH
ncbi:efflux RND transporter periplasmic adaptor subunit [bacterium]|nr:efflux RND transporter periplasmic adaptor subunit [bacterium]